MRKIESKVNSEFESRLRVFKPFFALSTGEGSFEFIKCGLTKISVCLTFVTKLKFTQNHIK